MKLLFSLFISLAALLCAPVMAMGQAGADTAAPARGGLFGAQPSGLIPDSNVAQAFDAPRQRYTLRSITFVGLRRTKPRIVEREMALRVGDVLAADSLEYYEERDSLRLQNLSLFTDVFLQFIPSGDGTDGIKLYVVLKERWYIWPELGVTLADRNFNVWWSEMGRDLRRINTFLAVADRNFRGNLEYLRVGGQLGYTNRATIEYRRPYIDKAQKHGIGFSGAYSQNAEHYYTTDRNKLRFFRLADNRPVLREGVVAFLYSYRPGYASRHLAELRYRDFRIVDEIALLNPDFFLDGSRRLRFVEAVYRFDYNGVDSWNYPLYGRKLVLIGTARAGWQGMKTQAFMNVEAALFQKISRRWFTSQVFRGRLSVPERVPYFLRSALGYGNEYVRGYEYYAIDGSHYGIVRGNLKFQALNTVIRGVPFRFLPSIPLAVFPKVFADGGYGRNILPQNSFLHNRPLYGFGAGVDIITAYNVKARLELSWNGLGERGFYFHQDSE